MELVSSNTQLVTGRKRHTVELDLGRREGLDSVGNIREIS